MAWTFVNPRVTTGNGHIDAACIYGKNTAGTLKYSGGGFCCGIKYVGSFSSQPEIWATWFTDEQFEDFTNAVGFSAGVSDTDNWRTEDTNFTVTWTVNRWLPKEQRSKEYYVNEYRFTAGDTITTYTYQYTSDTLYTKVQKTDIGSSGDLVLGGAFEGFYYSALFIAASTLALMIF